MPRIDLADLDPIDHLDADAFAPVRRSTPRDTRRGSPAPRPVRRDDGLEEFKCGHCKTFVGPTLTGGRHRNHCPTCLHSRHVDRSRPGDRLSRCRSLMRPVGTFCRGNGEQMLVHRCLGCGAERHCRVAADDNPITCLRLEPTVPRRGRWTVGSIDEEAIA